MKKSKRHWTLDKCIEEAKKYNTKKEWCLNSKGSYLSAIRNKWIDDCSKHMIKLGSKYLRLIYAFEFPDKSVYVGLTYNSNERKNEHLNPKRKKKSSVCKYIYKTGLQPEFKKLTDYINKDLAVIKEGEFAEKYKNEGWNILNKNKTGALGGSTELWTKQICILDAKKYKTKIEWMNKSNSAYQVAYRKNWFKFCCSHMVRNTKHKKYWTKSRCILDAKNYKQKSEWKNNSPSAYSSAIKNKWCKICTKHMVEQKKPNGFWDIKNSIKKAKECKNITEFSKKFGSAYNSMIKNGYLNKIHEIFS